MNLFDRLRKSKTDDPATAISAIPLIEEGGQENTSAQNSKVAGIAVAMRGWQSAEHKTDELLAKLRLHDCSDDPEPELIARVNNICYHLVEVKGWKFEQAMTAAAVWVAHHSEHRDEMSFTDVMQLFHQRIQVQSAPAMRFEDDDDDELF